jgi:hypothetical protein
VINWTEPVNCAITLYAVLAVVALGLLWISVRRGVLAPGYAIAPLLIVFHTLIWSVAGLYFRNFHFAGAPSFTISLWAIIIWLQAIGTLIWILVYRLRASGK